MYHYIFFDLDGTLTDSKEGILNSLRYAFDKLGEPVPPESTLIKFIGPPLQDSFAEFCGFSAERAAEAIAAFRERYEPVGKFENMAAPGMADLCARLKARGYVLALASSKPESLCVPICEKFGFTPSLAVVTGSPPVGDWSKADVIRETMRRLELTEAHKPEILMVGDRKFDVLGAKACGIACAGVEFFGYAAGAFTGAARKGRIGRFQLASGGSIFLDEVNLLTATMQPKFLRVLQEMEIDPVGGEKSIPIDVRVIAASNIPLETLVEAGQFRSDLYYRLNVIRIQAPTLRERKEDLPLLVDNFIHRLNYQLGMVIEGVAPGAMDLLMDYDWPGNVRELQNAVESAMNAADSPILRRRDFRQLEQRMQARRRRQLTGPGDFKLRPARQAFERELIRDALAAAGGNRVKAAALLDISRTVLYEKMEQYQLK